MAALDEIIVRLGPRAAEPLRQMCPTCEAPVLVALVKGRLIVAEFHEWEPRASCQSCQWTRARTGRTVSCARCDNSGYIGEKRPKVPMLAIDVAWSDDSGVRVIQPGTVRRRGEGLHQLHDCPGSLRLCLPADHSPTATGTSRNGAGRTSVGRGSAAKTKPGMAA